MAIYFTPPVRLLVPTTLPTPHPGNALFRHFGPRRQGVNVYLMPGNVLTEDPPVADTNALRVFHGGHIHEVDGATAALLTGAGYEVTVTLSGLGRIPLGTSPLGGAA